MEQNASSLHDDRYPHVITCVMRGDWLDCVAACLSPALGISSTKSTNAQDTTCRGCFTDATRVVRWSRLPIKKTLDHSRQSHTYVHTCTTRTRTHTCTCTCTCTYHTHIWHEHTHTHKHTHTRAHTHAQDTMSRDRLIGISIAMAGIAWYTKLLTSPQQQNTPVVALKSMNGLNGNHGSEKPWAVFRAPNPSLW